jgi:predicted metalloprotease
MRVAAVIACLLLFALGGCGGGGKQSPPRPPPRGNEAIAAMRTVPPPSPQDSELLRQLTIKRHRATIDQYMTAVLGSVDEYWTRIFKTSGRRPPTVFYLWIPPGVSTTTDCDAPADQTAAFYCPVDDTIYVGITFAYDLYLGVLGGLPGEAATGAHPYGDFSVAYVIAHEYAHNVQNELGIYQANPSRTAKPYELQADCLAGAWARSIFQEGLATPADLEEAVTTALAVGDFEFHSAQHHGTPLERHDALLTGYKAGVPAACAKYVPAR